MKIKPIWLRIIGYNNSVIFSERLLLLSFLLLSFLLLIVVVVDGAGTGKMEIVNVIENSFPVIEDVYVKL